MASWFALVTEEQILLINKVAGSIDSYMFEISLLFCLIFFDHLIYHVTLCAQKRIVRQDFHFLSCVLVTVLLE